MYPGITFTAESAIIQDTAEHQDVSQEKLRILPNIVFKALNVIWDQYGTIFGIFFEDSCSSFQTHQSVSARWDPDNYSRLDHNYEKILYFLKEFPKSILFLRSPLLFFFLRVKCLWNSSEVRISQMLFKCIHSGHVQVCCHEVETVWHDLAGWLWSIFFPLFFLCWTAGKPSTFLPATWSWPTWHLPLALRPSCHRLHRMIRRWSNHRRPYHPWFPHFMQAPRKGAPQFMDMNFNFYFMIFLRQDVVFEDAPFQALERQLYVTPLNSLSLAHHLLRLLRPRREWRRA